MHVLQAVLIDDSDQRSAAPPGAADPPRAFLVERQRRKHRQMLLISVGALLLAAVMEVLPHGRVAFAGLQEYPLPHLCTSRLLGYSCPGCGLTRSMIHLVHGNFSEAMQVHRFGWMVGALIFAQIPLRLHWLWKLRRATMPLPKRIGINSMGYLVLAILIVDWVARLALQWQTNTAVH